MLKVARSGEPTRERVGAPCLFARGGGGDGPMTAGSSLAERVALVTVRAFIELKKEEEKKEKRKTSNVTGRFNVRCLSACKRSTHVDHTVRLEAQIM